MTKGDVATMSLLVPPAWLAARLDDPNTAILDATLPPVGVLPPVDTHTHYLARHLPGAVFFDIEAFSDPVSGLPHTLPSAEGFARGMGTLGLRETMDFIVYEQEGVFSAPRAVWMLRTFGVRQVYLLDGGLQAWTEAGLPISSGPVERAPASFHARLDADAVVNFEQVQSLLAAGAQVLDARSVGRFAGSAPEPRPGLPSGHMPGATSVPFTDLANGFSTLATTINCFSTLACAGNNKFASSMTGQTLANNSSLPISASFGSSNIPQSVHPSPNIKHPFSDG